MTNPRDDRLFSSLSKHCKSPPGGDSQNSGFFSTGQGGRTVLPPLSSAFPTSPSSVSPGTSHPSYSQQQRTSPGKPDHGYSHYSPWAIMNIPHPQHSSHDHYDRYSQAQPYQYPSRSSPTIPPDPHNSRKLPPLNMPDRYQGSYGAVAPHVSNYGDIRSPTATYPTEYAPYADQASYSYPPVPGPRHHHSSHLPSVHHSQQMSMGMYPPERGMPVPAHVEAHGPSPYARGYINSTKLTEEPAQMVAIEEPTIKKKRKRADAAQLKVLNETYARTAFPSTEERAELAKKLDMSARSVQIWFQNKRQSMRQTTRQSSTSVPTSHQSFNMSTHPEEHSSFTTGSTSPTTVSHSAYATRPGQDSRSVPQESRISISHRREEDPRKWHQPGRY